MSVLNTKLVLDLHAALRRTGVGNKLPDKSLAAFFTLAHDRAVTI
jgi:hypothetical protein